MVECQIVGWFIVRWLVDVGLLADFSSCMVGKVVGLVAAVCAGVGSPVCDSANFGESGSGYPAAPFFFRVPLTDTFTGKR